jgi:hypothetical protein
MAQAEAMLHGRLDVADIELIDRRPSVLRRGSLQRETW